MFPRKVNKQNKLKRLILKILNVYAYDRETLKNINPDNNNNQKNHIEFNDKSLNFSLGYLNLTRKINKLDIYFWYSPNNNLWNSTKRWKRIIPNIDKKTLILVSILSLKNSLIEFLKINNLDVTLHLIADNSNDDFDNRIYKIITDKRIKIINHKSKIKGNRGSYLECCDNAESAEDLIFFVEDDYLFEINCIDEIINTYSKISSLLNKDIIICPSDYPFYYDALYNTSLFVGKNYKWRNVGETLLTFLISKKIFKKYRNNIRNVGEEINEPFEKPLHDIYKKEICISPINSLCYHISRSVPSTTENWTETWNFTYEQLKKF